MVRVAVVVEGETSVVVVEFVSVAVVVVVTGWAVVETVVVVGLTSVKVVVEVAGETTVAVVVTVVQLTIGFPLVGIAPVVVPEHTKMVPSLTMSFSFQIPTPPLFETSMMPPMLLVIVPVLVMPVPEPVVDIVMFPLLAMLPSLAIDPPAPVINSTTPAEIESVSPSLTA